MKTKILSLLIIAAFVIGFGLNSTFAQNADKQDNKVKKVETSTQNKTMETKSTAKGNMNTTAKVKDDTNSKEN
ncbi:MAG: hypothetical protein ABI550_03570, partial [Ignavibacteriaceae bacterium]